MIKYPPYIATSPTYTPDVSTIPTSSSIVIPTSGSSFNSDLPMYHDLHDMLDSFKHPLAEHISFILLPFLRSNSTLQENTHTHTIDYLNLLTRQYLTAVEMAFVSSNKFILQTYYTKQIESVNKYNELEVKHTELETEVNNQIILQKQNETKMVVSNEIDKLNAEIRQLKYHVDIYQKTINKDKQTITELTNVKNEAYYQASIYEKEKKDNKVLLTNSYKAMDALSDKLKELIILKTKSITDEKEKKELVDTRIILNNACERLKQNEAVLIAQNTKVMDESTETIKKLNSEIVGYRSKLTTLQADIKKYKSNEIKLLENDKIATDNETVLKNQIIKLQQELKDTKTLHDKTKQDLLDSQQQHNKDNNDILIYRKMKEKEISTLKREDEDCRLSIEMLLSASASMSNSNSNSKSRKRKTYELEEVDPFIDTFKVLDTDTVVERDRKVELEHKYMEHKRWRQMNNRNQT